MNVPGWAVAAVVFFAGCPLWAQSFNVDPRTSPIAVFSGLSASGDGSTLVFSGTPIPRGAGEAPAHEKILRWTRAEGFTIHAAVEFAVTGAASSPFQLKSPRISTDGATVAYTGFRMCFAPSMFGGCRTDTTPQSTVMRAGKVAASMRGEAVVSRNGRWAVAGPQSATEFHSVLVDLETGQKTELAADILFPSLAYLVLDDGSILTRAGHKVGRNGERSTLDLPAGTIPRDVSADGAVLALFTNPNGDEGDLLIYEDATASIAEIARSVRAPRLTDDGSSVVYLASPGPGLSTQLFLARTDSPDKWQITEIPEGVLEGTISGDGQIAFGLTNLNRIFRYTVNSGEIEFLNPPTPRPLYPNTVVQGSEMILQPSGLGELRFLPEDRYPQEFNGLRLKAGTLLLPLTRIAPLLMTYQVPYDFPLGTHTLAWDLGGEHPFRFAEVKLEVVPFLPWARGYECICPRHQSGSDVSRSDPALPGELITVNVNGLGAVAPAIPFATPAPASPVSRPVRPVRVELVYDGGRIALEEVDAIVIPGSAGGYRVSFRMPARGWPDAPDNLLFGFLRLFSPMEAGDMIGPATLVVKVR